MQTFQDVTEEDSSYGLVKAIQRQEWPWRGDYVMAAFDLAVCADESGIHDDAPLCILSGYIAGIRRWVEFEARWELVLKRFDVSDFHSTDFFAVDENGKRVGKYRRWSNRDERASYGDWTDTEAMAFVGALMDVIHASSVRPLGAFVEWMDFQSFTYGERKYLTGGKLDANLRWVSTGAPTKPYFLLYDHCLSEAGHITKAGKKTLFIFDQQKQFEGRALHQYGETVLSFLKDGNPIARRFAGVIFQERLDVPGLQAADLYTHCWYRHIAKPKARGPRYEALDSLTQKVPGMKQYTRDHMAGLFRNLPPNVREFVRTWSEQDER